MSKKKDFYVLGIHDGHCAGAAIIKNGKVQAAINEERLTTVKNQAGIPILSIKKVFEITGITPSDISLVAIASYIRVVGDPQEEKKLPFFKLHMLLAPYLHNQRFINFAVDILHRLNPRQALLASLKEIGMENIPVTFVDHHLCHASSAFYQRPWKDKTLIFTLDGMGDGLSATVSIGEKNKITRIAASTYFDSLGNNIYAEITRFLGLKRGEHEYKVMGLAPYGNPKKTIDVFRKVMCLNPHKPLEFENRTRFYMEQLEPLYQKNLRYKRFDDIAAGAQKFFEDMVSAWVKEAIKLTKIHKIVGSGGSFLNVKTNMVLRELDEVEDIFIYPAADDGGLAVGAALEGYVSYCNNNKITPDKHSLDSIYFGQDYTKEKIKQFLLEKKLIKKVKIVEPLDVAKLIANGKIIARFAGRDEWGPRALGNRSIMADPRKLEIVPRLNHAIKHRDFWMPFAPSILEESQNRYLKNGRFSPYMIEAFNTKKEASEIIATIHPADKTARPMTVNSWNKPWQDILRAFKKTTGVGAILNTSFNLHGYPLVGTPNHALWTFQNSGLDGVLFDEWLLSK